MQNYDDSIFSEPISLAKEFYTNYYSNSDGDALKYRCDFMLCTLVSQNNIRLDGYPFKNQTLCGMLTLDKYENTLVYNSKHLAERRNFTIAHELGHYFLHRDKESQFQDRSENMLDSTISVFEIQANAFAAEIVIPEHVLLLMLSYRYNFFRIGKITKASYECLKWRMVTLLIQKYKLSRADSILLIENYKNHSEEKSPKDSAIFSVLYPGAMDSNRISGIINNLREDKQRLSQRRSGLTRISDQFFYPRF